MFVDKVKITVQAGHGGHGLASFRREKYLPFGGPDGGDGGKGGDVFLVANEDMRDLSYFRHKAVFKAANGGTGGRQKMHGAYAPTMSINVPIGTTIYVKNDGKQLLIADLLRNGQRVLVAGGGKGGLGNVHFATSTRQAPKTAQPGEEGEKNDLVLEYKLIVDACIIGRPNSGKSTLLAAISGAKPTIAAYPFTTREPVLGTVEQDLEHYIWAELPGLAENAHQGKGLGNNFLLQSERASVLIYLVDINEADIEKSLDELVNEVSLYNSNLVQKKSVIAVNKIDAVEGNEQIDLIIKKLGKHDWPVYPISAKDKLGLCEMVSEVHKLIDADKREQQKVDIPEMVFRPRPKNEVG